MYSLIDGNQAAKRGFDGGSWKLTVDKLHWKCESSRFGSVEYAVAANAEGKPLYDRPVYREAPHVITVPWCRAGMSLGTIEVGLILEERAHGGGKFWGVPRGFLKPGETPEFAALREAGEEAGVSVIHESKLLGHINPNPTFVGTEGPVVALEIDKKRLVEIAPKRNEKIYQVQFLSMSTWYEHMLQGEYEGGNFKDGVSLAAFMLFTAHATLN